MTWFWTSLELRPFGLSSSKGSLFHSTLKGLESVNPSIVDNISETQVFLDWASSSNYNNLWFCPFLIGLTYLALFLVDLNLSFDGPSVTMDKLRFGIDCNMESLSAQFNLVILIPSIISIGPFSLVSYLEAL